MLYVRTGMKPELEIAQAHFKTAKFISGKQNLESLDLQVGKDCTAIASFGMCGGIRPAYPVVGQTLIATELIGPAGEFYQCDPDWNHRIFLWTRAYMERWYSNGQYDTCNNEAERQAAYAKTLAWCIDDESLCVAQLAKARNIPFVIVRTVSDAFLDDVSITSKILNDEGDVDIVTLLKKIAEDLKDPAGPEAAFIKIWRNYNLCKTELGVAATQLASDFRLAP